MRRTLRIAESRWFRQIGMYTILPKNRKRTNHGRENTYRDGISEIRNESSSSEGDEHLERLVAIGEFGAANEPVMRARGTGSDRQPH